MKTIWIIFLIVGLKMFADHPQAEIKRLIEGNKRFQNNKQQMVDYSKEVRKAAAKGQDPFAIILGCSDSRVAPEIIFDQGIGDLFVVRVAGNVVTPSGLESIWFAVEQLHSNVIVVLGHESCGAVNAVVKGGAKKIPVIAKAIEPAVEKARKEPGNVLENAIDANVQLMVEQLKKEPFIAEKIKKDQVAVVGGVYHFKSGEVVFDSP